MIAIVAGIRKHFMPKSILRANARDDIEASLVVFLYVIWLVRTTQMV
jgi:hypothetical protein